MKDVSVISRICGVTRSRAPRPGFDVTYLAFEAIIPFDILYQTSATKFSKGAYASKWYKTMDDFIEIADALFDQLDG